MVDLQSRKDLFVDGLAERAGWDREHAEEHFLLSAPKFEIGNEIDFELSEAERLCKRYPKILIVPMMYLIEDNKLYFIKE